MQSKIDDVVRQIQESLDQPPPAISELSSALKVLGVDSHSQAVELRALLMRWAEDISFSEPDRQYAKQRLEQLPPF